MFSTGDDIVLSVWRERGEEGGIARDTHYQIAVLIRMFFRFQQRFAGKPRGFISGRDKPRPPRTELAVENRKTRPCRPCLCPAVNLVCPHR